MLQELLEYRKMTLKEVADLSGIPYATLNDLKNEKKHIDDCSVQILRKLAELFGMDMDAMYRELSCYRKQNFDAYVSTLYEELEQKGVQSFLIECIATDRVARQVKRNRLYAYYLVGVADHLCRVNGIPLAERFDAIRSWKMEDLLPGGVSSYMQWDEK